MQQQWLVKSDEEFWQVINGWRPEEGAKLAAKYSSPKDGPRRMTVYRALKILEEVGLTSNWASRGAFLAALRQRASELGQGRARLAVLAEEARRLAEDTMKKILRGRHCPSFDPGLALAVALDKLAAEQGRLELEPLALRIVAPADLDVEGDNVEPSAVASEEPVPVADVVNDADDVLGDHTEDVPGQPGPAENQRPPEAAQRPAQRPRHICPRCRCRRVSATRGGHDRTRGAIGRTAVGDSEHSRTESDESPGYNPKTRGAGRTKSRRGQTQNDDDRNFREAALVGRLRVRQPEHAMHVLKCRFPDGRVTTHEETSMAAVHSFLARNLPGDDIMDAQILVDGRPFDAMGFIALQRAKAAEERAAKAEMKAQELERSRSPGGSFFESIAHGVLEQYEHMQRRREQKQTKKEKRRNGRRR